jgi:hypothetical protein
LEPFNSNLPQNTQIPNNPSTLKVQLNQIKHTIKISQNLVSFVMDTNYNKRDCKQNLKICYIIIITIM